MAETVSVGALRYDVVMDHSEFTKSASEVAQVIEDGKKEFEESAESVEHLSDALNEESQAAEKAAKTTAMLGQELQEESQAADDAAQATSRLDQAMASADASAAELDEAMTALEASTAEAAEEMSGFEAAAEAFGQFSGRLELAAGWLESIQGMYEKIAANSKDFSEAERKEAEIAAKRITELEERWDRLKQRMASEVLTGEENVSDALAIADSMASYATGEGVTEDHIRIMQRRGQRYDMYGPGAESREIDAKMAEALERTNRQLEETNRHMETLIDETEKQTEKIEPTEAL